MPSWHTRRWPWHRLFILCLDHQFPPDFILDLYIPNDVKGESCFIDASQSRPALDALPKHSIWRCDHIITRAVHSSQRIDIDDKVQCIRRILRGDEDATLAILLPYLTNLKSLTAPYSSKRTTEVFRKICWVYSATSHGAADLPFAKLTLIWTTSTNMEYAWPLCGLKAYLGLPSLRRVIIHGAREQVVEVWPTDIARPSCPEVFIDEGSISREVVANMAMAWRTPVVFRHFWSQPGTFGIDGPDEPDWDHCEVTGSTDESGYLIKGTRRVVLGLRDGGGEDVVGAVEMNVKDTSRLPG